MDWSLDSLYCSTDLHVCVCASTMLVCYHNYVMQVEIGNYDASSIILSAKNCLGLSRSYQYDQLSSYPVISTGNRTDRKNLY